jgi:hypothetical protein
MQAYPLSIPHPEEQPSPPFVLRSSHCSPARMTPSPHLLDAEEIIADSLHVSVLS